MRNEDARNGIDRVLLKNLQESQAHTFEIIHDLKNSLRDTVKESKSTQFLAKSMFILTFLLGFGMFIIAIYFAFLEKQFFTIVFGGIGLATIITFFIANPPLKIQDSRSNYA